MVRWLWCHRQSITQSRKSHHTITPRLAPLRTVVVLVVAAFALAIAHTAGFECCRKRPRRRKLERPCKKEYVLGWWWWWGWREWSWDRRSRRRDEGRIANCESGHAGFSREREWERQRERKCQGECHGAEQHGLRGSGFFGKEGVFISNENESKSKMWLLDGRVSGREKRERFRPVD